MKSSVAFVPKSRKWKTSSTGLSSAMLGRCADVLAKLEEMEAENAELKRKLESVQATAYAESVDAGMRERRLRRALYKACANLACAKMEYERLNSNMFMFGITTEKEVSWESTMKKCRAKAEEYK